MRAAGTGLRCVPQPHVAHVRGQRPGVVSLGHVSKHSAPVMSEPAFVSWIRKIAKTATRICRNTDFRVAQWREGTRWILGRAAAPRDRAKWTRTATSIRIP